ncbi:MAG: [Fe-Fe] hydrogenase large subunit C-terminal domain-containing protein, partial [Bacteroidales bacterium]
MESNLVIYTEKINCQDCYKCIKVCPVKSIKIEDFSASVINESCIFCGECINACPANAKKYRDDTHLILDWAINQEKMIASIAPSFLSDFGDEKLENILKAFYVLGFSAVSETALGAELVAVETNRVLKESDEDVVLATCCPSVVNYIKIHQPNLEKNLAPVVSPMIAHARQLRAAGYNNYKIVFVGPCIAKKRESDIYGDEVDAVITFQEFTALLEREGIFFSDMEKIELPEKFVIGASERAGLFPVDYGMISTMCREKESVDANFLSFSGMKAVM